MGGEILGVRSNSVRKDSREPIHAMDGLIDNPIEDSLRQFQIAMIGEHGRLAQQAAAQGHASGVELGQVQVNHVMLQDQFPGQVAKGGHDDTLANPEEYRGAHDLDTVLDLAAGQIGIILGSQHRNLVPLLG